MQRLESRQPDARGAAVRVAVTPRLAGPWLVVARVIWLGLVIPSLGLFVASLPIYFVQVQRACTDLVTCNLAGTLTTKGLHDLSALGLTPGGYASLLTAYFTLIVTIWSGVGFLIFWRRSDDWFALLTAFFLVMFNITYPGFPISALAFAFPSLNTPILFMGALGLAALAMFIVLFPNGRLVPRWMIVFLLLAMLSTISTVIPPTARFNPNSLPGWLTGGLNLVVNGTIVGAQIYRYMRGSTSVERQQMKWVIYGIVIVLSLLFMVFPVVQSLVPALASQSDLQSNSLPTVLFGLVAYPLVLLLLPVTIGIAILRSRLYEIDVIINRTLVYGSLTILLALVYFGLIVGLEALARLLTGLQGLPPIVIVASTLAIAVLFDPLRRRIQRVIDRRFYRHKYDAAKTVAAFSATLRSEVDLSALSAHLVAVVRETMQPRHVSLWLRPPSDGGRPRTPWDAAPPPLS